MKTISRIAYSNDKKNKTRSILIMMSICLTTMLLVIISTMGNGMIRLQKSQAAGSYGSNYIYHVPIVPIFIMIFLVGLLQIVLSCVLSSNLKKETLVERIRYQG